MASDKATTGRPATGVLAGALNACQKGQATDLRIAKDRVLVVENERAPQAVAVNNQTGRDDQRRQPPRAACGVCAARAPRGPPFVAAYRRAPSIANRSSGAGCHNGSSCQGTEHTRRRGWIEADYYASSLALN